MTKIAYHHVLVNEMIDERWCLPLHGPRCFKLTLWPPHCARIKWHRVAYVWLSVPHTARAFDSSHSPPFAVQLKICMNGNGTTWSVRIEINHVSFVTSSTSLWATWNEKRLSAMMSFKCIKCTNARTNKKTISIHWKWEEIIIKKKRNAKLLANENNENKCCVYTV